MGVYAFLIHEMGICTFFFFLSVTVSLEAHHQTVEILHSNLVKLFSPLVHFCIWHIYILTCPFQNGVAW